MATLFPIRSDEDETSKIIKNVLLDGKDELDHIFDEFIHLTEESIITNDDDDEDDDDEDDEDEEEEDDDDEEEEEEEDEEDDDDDDDEDDDDDDDDDDEDDNNNNNNNNIENDLDERAQPRLGHEPQTWNLDQFIPVVKKEAAAAAAVATPTIKTEKLASPVVTKQVPSVPSIPSVSSSVPSIPSVSSSVPSIPSVSSSVASSASSNYLVQIDLSKLKRIPSLKVSAISTAKALKHEADAEKDKTQQALKYLKSASYFVLNGHEKAPVVDEYTSYIEALPLFKHVLRMSMPSKENLDNMTNLKVHTLCIKCMSLVHMKLYRLKERELPEFNKIIDQIQPVKNSSLPGDLLGVKPTLLNAYRKQLAIFSNLRCAIDYWQRAEQFCEQHPAVRIFFTTIETNVGPLTQTSSIPKLIETVKCGFKLLKSFT